MNRRGGYHPPLRVRLPAARKMSDVVIRDVRGPPFFLQFPQNPL